MDDVKASEARWYSPCLRIRRIITVTLVGGVKVDYELITSKITTCRIPPKLASRRNKDRNASSMVARNSHEIVVQ
jgi:hypothetical protein